MNTISINTLTSPGEKKTAAAAAEWLHSVWCSVHVLHLENINTGELLSKLQNQKCTLNYRKKPYADKL